MPACHSINWKCWWWGCVYWEKPSMCCKIGNKYKIMSSGTQTLNFCGCRWLSPQNSVMFAEGHVCGHYTPSHCFIPICFMPFSLTPFCTVYHFNLCFVIFSFNTFAGFELLCQPLISNGDNIFPFSSLLFFSPWWFFFFPVFFYCASFLSWVVASCSGSLYRRTPLGNVTSFLHSSSFMLH